MASFKIIVLVTGANSGIGYELAAQLMTRERYHILLGSRSVEKGKAAVNKLQSRNKTHSDSVELLPIDVTDDATIEKAAEAVKHNHGKLDMIVNNAGTSAMDITPMRQQLREAFDINAIGPAVLTKAFAPLIQASTAPSRRIVNISSGVGSIGRCLDPTSAFYGIQQVQYRASKTALNMVTACQWVEYGPDIKVFAYDPGFTVSNLGPHNNTESGARSAAESVMPLIDVLEGKRDDEAGLFLHNTGVYPW